VVSAAFPFRFSDAQRKINKKRLQCGGGIIPERGVLPRAGRSRGCGGGGGGLLGGLGHPQLVATPNHLLRRVEGLSVDHGADVARQFADEEGDLRLDQGRWLQGGQIVPKHRGPGLTAAQRVVQPLAGSLLVSHAIGFQEELLQSPVRVGDGGGVARQRVDGGRQREGEFTTAQWNFMIDWVMFAVANWESRLVNQHCGESA
jgi:hypothetical protein